MSTTFRIYESNIPVLDDKIDAANRRLERNGISERFSYTIVDTEISTLKSGEVVVKHFYEMNRPEIGFGGWSFLATVTFEEGGTIMRVNPDKELPVGFERPDTHRCDHCGVDRARTNSYVLQNEDSSLVQVGSTCLSLFLGVEVKGLWALGAFDAEELAELDAERSDRGGNGYAAETHYDTRFLLALALVLSNNGLRFVSRATAQDYDKVATASEVFSCIQHLPGRDRARNEEVQEALSAAWSKVEHESELLDEIVDYGLSLGTSDYAENLRVALGSEKISTRNAPLVISVIGVWFRSKNERTSDYVPYSEEFVGSVKERLRSLELRVDFMKEIETDYGVSTLIVFRDEQNHCFKWFASASVYFETGDELVLTGTVKSHDVYQGTSQTSLTRCKVESVKETVPA